MKTYSYGSTKLTHVLAYSKTNPFSNFLDHVLQDVVQQSREVVHLVDMPEPDAVALSKRVEQGYMYLAVVVDVVELVQLSLSAKLVVERYRLISNTGADLQEITYKKTQFEATYYISIKFCSYIK